MSEYPTINETIGRIVALSRRDFKSAEAVGLKLMEEVGELAEAVNYKLGNLPHKALKESAYGEAADVIQNVIALVANAFPEHSSEHIFEELESQLHVKTDKWESVLVEKKPPVSAQDVKNAMCIGGDINEAVDRVYAADSPDEVHIVLTNLVHRAIDKSFGQEESEDQVNARLRAFLSDTFGWSEQTAEIYQRLEPVADVVDSLLHPTQ